MLEHVAAESGLRPEVVREANFYQVGQSTPSGSVIGSVDADSPTRPKLERRGSREDICTIGGLGGMSEHQRLVAQAKFVAKSVRFGRPIEAGVALWKLLGLGGEDELVY